MLAELRTDVADRVVWLEGHCRADAPNHPNAPFVEILRRWLGVREGEPDLVVRTKLRTRLDALMGPETDVILPLFARLLSIASDAALDAVLAEVPVEQLAGATRAAFVRWVEALCDRQPVAIVLEDTQDADEPTSALTEELLALTDSVALLVGCSLRRDPGSVGWRLRTTILAEYGHRATELSLKPLSEDASAQLVEAISPTGALDAGSRRDLVSRAEGNPLYLEEIMRALAESGGLQRTKSWTMSVTAMGQLLPPALEGLLTFRIHRLPQPALRLAQIAAVIGREFPTRILERVAGAESVRAELPNLLRREIVRETRRFPELWCSFAHGMLQEATLSTLLPSRMRGLYREVGAAFEADGDPEDRLGQLAFYFYRSDDQAAALSYLERAAVRADGLRNGTEAIELWRRVGRVAERVGDDDARARAAAAISSSAIEARTAGN
jgi:predicted ATPase